MNLKLFARRLRDARHARGLTKEELAIESNVLISSICAYESAKTPPGGKNLFALCRALGISADHLLGLPAVDPLVELDERLDRTTKSNLKGD